MSAQTQVQRVTHKSQMTTKELVQTVLSASIGCITYLRGIFPDDTFFEERYNADTDPNNSKQGARQETGQRLMRLRRNGCTAVSELLDYLEDGVFDAIQKQYLMSIILSISLDTRHADNVHEAYTFQISYPNGESPSISIREKSRKKSTLPMPVDAAKRSIQLLFRQLIAMTQSLAPLPDDVNKVISIRLFFNDETPDTYQPPGFRAAAERESAKFVTRFEKERPHDQKIGAIDTGFHACTLRITTIGELEEDPIDRAQDVKVWDAEHHAKVGHGSRLGDEDLTECPVGEPQCHSQVERGSTDHDIPAVSLDIDRPMVDSGLSCSLEATQILESESQGAADSQRITRSQTKGRAFQRETQVISMSQPGDAAGKTCRFEPNDNNLNDLSTTYKNMKLARMPQNGKPDIETSQTPSDTKIACSRTMLKQKNKPHESQGDIVTCECGDTSEDGIMVQCDACNGWSHLPCYGYWDSVIEEGYVHKCYTCMIQKCDDLENIRSLAIMRKALHGLWLDGYQYSSTREFGASIGVKDLRTAASILQKLVKEKWVISNSSDSFMKRRSARQNKGRPTYNVVRSHANKLRLSKEYFDPRRGLEDYWAKPRSVYIHDVTKEVVGDGRQIKSGKDHIPDSQDDETHDGLMQKDSQFRVMGSPTTMADERRETSTRPAAKRKHSHEIVQSSVPINDSPLGVSTATTDDEMDDDLSVPLAGKNGKQEDNAGNKPACEMESTKSKRLKISIVEKPIISYAFDTMSN